MATGATAPFFWFEIVVGILIPFCILVFAKNRARMGLVAAVVCVVVGVFFGRVLQRGGRAGRGGGLWAVSARTLHLGGDRGRYRRAVSLGAGVLRSRALLPGRAAKRDVGFERPAGAPARPSRVSRR